MTCAPHLRGKVTCAIGYRANHRETTDAAEFLAIAIRERMPVMAGECALGGSEPSCFSGVVSRSYRVAYGPMRARIHLWYVETLDPNDVGASLVHKLPIVLRRGVWHDEAA